MKKLLVMMAVVASVLLASCSQEKSIYQEETKYLPVRLQGSDKWSILNVETGDVVAKDAWVNAPSPVVDDMFWVYNDNNRIDIYNAANCKEPVNKEVYGSATCYSGGYAIVSKPGEPLQVIDKECNKVADLSPSILTASMFSNGRSIVHTDLDRYGYVDEKGDTVIRADLGYAAGFNEDDVALVSFSEASDSAKVLSVIDKNGKKLYDLDSEKYQIITPYYRMGVLVVAKNDSLVCLDRHGKEVANPHETPKKIKEVNYRDRVYAGADKYMVIKGDRMGLVDKDNNVLIPFDYQFIQNLTADRYVVGKDSVMMLVDDHGKQVGKAKFIDFRPFSPESQAVRGYINLEVTAANLLSFIDEDMVCFAKKGSTLMDVNQLVGVQPAQYVGMRQIDRPMMPMICSYMFDKEIASLSGTTASTDSVATDSIGTGVTVGPTAEFNYDSKLRGVAISFLLLECAPGTEESLCRLMSSAMGAKGFNLNPDGTFTSSAGTAITMGYEKGVFKLNYYFDPSEMKPLPRESRSI
jgi:hypothetical protein